MSDERKHKRLMVDLDSMLNAASGQSRISKMPKVYGDSMHNVVPDELWINLLEYLNPMDLIRMGETSRRYRVLCSDPSLWKRMVFDWLNVKENVAAFKIATNRGAQVERVKLTDKTFASGCLPLEFDITENIKMHFELFEQQLQIYHPSLEIV